MQTVHISTNAVSSNPAHGDVYSIQHLLGNQVCQCLVTGRWFSTDTSGSSTITTDHHDIIEILLKVAIKTINQPRNIFP